MSLRNTFSSIILLFCTSAYAQVEDDFSDGDFTSGVIWSGNESDFEVESGRLHLNAASTTAVSYLSTGSSLINQTIWEFHVDLGFNPSSSNQMFVYLVSDQADLSGSLNGYFVKIGNAGDEVSLYKQIGLTQTEIIDGTDGILNSSNVSVRIRVTRDQNGNWELLRDASGGDNYVSEGTITDDQFISSSYFGLLCDYTSTRSNLFWMDDVHVYKPIDVLKIVGARDTVVSVKLNQYVKYETIIKDNFTIKDEFGNVLTKDVKRHSAVRDSIYITLNTALTQAEYIYQFTNLSDSLTEQTTALIEGAFSYFEIGQPELFTLNSNQIVLDFSESLNEYSALYSAAYVVDQGIGEPQSISFDPVDGSKITLTFASAFLEGVDYEIRISGVLSPQQTANFSGAINFQFVIPLVITSASVLSQNQVLLTFNNSLDVATSENNSNYLVDFGIGNPSSATLQMGDQSVLLIYVVPLDSGNYTVTISGVTDTNENVISNSGNTFFFSYLPLEIAGIDQVDNEMIRLGFNQKVEQLSAETLTNYVISNDNPTLAILENTDSTMLLTFPDLGNSTYQLKVIGIENKIENSTIDDNQFIDFEKPTPVRDIIITEIMADPTPTIGQPEAEYIEIFNRSIHSVNIQNFLLNGVVLPAFTMGPQTYLLISSSVNYTNFFSAVPNAIGQSGFDALSNAGDVVVLVDQFGNEVDSLFYTVDWYDDLIKDDGGYSLELINPDQLCSEDNNWTASNHASGGTPGMQNSVYSEAPDVTGPHVLSLEVLSPNVINILFDEPLDEATVLAQSFNLSAYTVTNVSIISTYNIEITLDQNLVSETNYVMDFDGVKDCAGNLLQDLNYSFYYDITAPAYLDYVILSENEIALKFSEQLNKTEAEKESNFLLNGIVPSKAILQDSAISRVHLQFEAGFVENTTYMLSIENMKDVAGNLAGLQQEPFIFVSQIDSVFVMAANILALKFDEKPSIVSAQNTSNYKLLSLGSPVEVVIDQSDSALVRLSFAKNFAENTQTKIYVENLKRKWSNESLITPAIEFVYDTKAPDLLAVEVLNLAELKVSWTEAVNTKTAISASRYKLEDGEIPIQVELLSDSAAVLVFSNSFEIEKVKSLSVTGIPDYSGNVFATARKRDFIYDPKPPRLNKIIRASDSTVRLTFHEKLMTDSIFIKTNFELDGINPVTASVQGPDSLQTTLYFDAIADAQNITFTFKNTRDQRGNIANDSTFHLNTENPNNLELIPLSDAKIQFIFSEAMSASIEQTLNYGNAPFPIVSIVRANEQSVILELEGRLKDQDTLRIEFFNITDAAGNSLQQTDDQLIFNTYFESYQFLDDQTIELGFTSLFETISANQFELAGKKSQLAILDGKDKQIVRLFFSDPLLGNESSLLSWNGLTDVYNRKIPDYAISVLNDKLPPILLSIESDFFGVLILGFSEALEITAAESPNLYTIATFGNPVSAKYSSDSSVTLDFSNQLIAGQLYDITIQDLPDLAGNFLQNQTISFTYSPPPLPDFGEVIITEIMADPAPVLGLPEAEYVELYNHSANAINLKALRLVDASSSAALPDYEFGPGEYVLLASNTNVSRFFIANKLGVTSFPSLGNTQDSLVLINIQGALVDRVVYNLDWYGDSDKDDGGYSLELINPESQCFGKANWTASVSESGGTPGAQNSVYSLVPDDESPAIVSYDIISNNALLLHFSEPMDSISLISGSFEISNLTIELVVVADTYFENVEINFSENLISGRVYSLTISGPQDCSGNVMNSTDLEFGLGRRPDFNELLITEIMADPDPVLKDLPNTEYLEIYNNTDDLLSLAGIYLTDGADTTSLAAQMLSSHQYLILSPTAASGDFGTYGSSMGLSNWPSLANAGEQLSLWFETELIFSIRYDLNWHDEDKDGGGYALEMKDLTNPCGERLVWGSATSLNGGTPGSINSNAASVPDNFGPELLSAFVVQSTVVRLTFSESLDSQADQTVQISIEPNLSISQLTIDELNSDEMLLTINSELEVNLLYQLSVSNLFDCNGNEIIQGETTFVRPGEADSLSLIINEILFDPKTGGVDFVEVYNNSAQYIDLKNWNISRVLDGQLDQIRVISEVENIIPPNEYRVLTADPDALILQYSSGKYEQFIGMTSFPTYANNEGTVVLLGPDLKIMDQFSYTDDYHSSLLKTVDGVSLERIDFNAPTQSASNWVSASSTVGFATPGYLNSQSFEAPQISGALEIEPRVFVPGSASLAHPSFTTINYQFEQAGKFANVRVYDIYGRPIAELANGASLSTSGFLRWDGTDNTGKLVRSGYYVVVFEVYDGSGKKDVLKETVVVGW